MAQTKRDILQKYLDQSMQVAKRIIDNASKAYANSLQSVNDRKRQVLNDLVKNVVPVASAQTIQPTTPTEPVATSTPSNTTKQNKGYSLVPKADGGYTVEIPSKEGGKFTLQSVIKGTPQYTWTPPEGYEKIADPKSITAYDKVIKNPKGQDMWGVPKANASQIMASIQNPESSSTTQASSTFMPVNMYDVNPFEASGWRQNAAPSRGSGSRRYYSFTPVVDNVTEELLKRRGIRMDEHGNISPGAYVYDPDTGQKLAALSYGGEGNDPVDSSWARGSEVWGQSDVRPWGEGNPMPDSIKKGLDALRKWYAKYNSYPSY